MFFFKLTLDVPSGGLNVFFRERAVQDYRIAESPDQQITGFLHFLPWRASGAPFHLVLFFRLRAYFASIFPLEGI